MKPLYKLYKELITDSDPILIGEYATIKDAKDETVRIISNDNYESIGWISSLNASGEPILPIEMSMTNNEYKFYIN